MNNHVWVQIPLAPLELTDNVFINKSTWERFSKQELDAYIERVFNHYRDQGFPYYPTSLDWRQNEFRKLRRYTKPVLCNDTLRQTMHGLALAWSYHPYSFDVPCNGKLTPKQVFDNDDLLRRAIRKRMKMGDNMSDSALRKMLKIFSGAQGVSNFRPTAARAIYNEFCSGGTTWDMCMGYGGRLLGFITSNTACYIGTDPNKETVAANIELTNQFASKETHLFSIGSEDFSPDRNSIDLVFTSPPYFDTEKYAQDQSQSYVRFPDYNDWLEGFLKRSLHNAHQALKPDGFLVVNIADSRGFPLEQDFIKICTEVGFVHHIRTMKLSLSSFKSKRKYKFEPVFVLKKRRFVK